MPAAFLHGVETFEFLTGPTPISVVKSAVIGLVGSAPTWAAVGAPALWNPSWAVTVGQKLVDSNGNIQQCTVAGTTGTAIPTWGTAVNATVADGTATWKLVTLGSLLQAPTRVSGSNLGSAGSGQAGQFGPMIQGYSIPYALWEIFQQNAGAGPAGANVIVVNVFNPYTHMTVSAAAPMSMPASGAQSINLGHMGVWNVLVQNAAKVTTYVLGTDFTLDAVNGVITAKTGGTLTVGEALSISFNYADPSKLADSDLVGTVTGAVYTGIQAFKTTYGTMGFFPKILIAPMASGGVGQSVGSGDQTVAAALTSMAQTIRAVCCIDSAAGTTPATAISNRGASNNAFNTSSDRAILCYPQEQFYDLGLLPTGVTLNSAGAAVQAVANVLVVGPYSPWFAGALAAKDLQNGYWWSPSNTQLNGPSGPDVTLYSSIIDSAADVNNLNAQGIVTIFQGFATGLRVWGNRSAAYPTVTTPNNFIPIRRTLDVVEESVQLAMLQFIDQPISNALISAILASVNAFIRSLIQRGALMPGSAATFNPAENPATQVAAGQLVFDIDLMPPPPAERLTFNVNVDITLLNNLVASVQTTSSVSLPAAAA